MEVSFSIGYWLIPLIITILSYGLAFYVNREPATDYATAAVGGLLTIIALGISTIISLLSWLIYFIIV